MCDRPTGSNLNPIELKITPHCKLYNPNKHCVFCLEEEHKLNPTKKLSSTDNGRTKVKEV